MRGAPLLAATVVPVRVRVAPAAVAAIVAKDARGATDVTAAMIVTAAMTVTVAMAVTVDAIVKATGTVIVSGTVKTRTKIRTLTRIRTANRREKRKGAVVLLPPKQRSGARTKIVRELRHLLRVMGMTQKRRRMERKPLPTSPRLDRAVFLCSFG